MENQGWIRIYRKSLESSVWDNPIFWKVWCWCLMKAAHKKHIFPFNQQDFEVLPGQFISGRDKASVELRISPRQYRTAIKYLKSTSRLTTKSTNKFTVFTILKWDLYQNENLSDQQNDQQATSKRPANDQQATTYKNDKNVKNDKKKRFVPPTLEDVKKYILENPELSNIDPTDFWKGYNDGGWIDTQGKPVRNWKLKLRTRSNYGKNRRQNTDDRADSQKPFVR